jgi:hypothetical protein
MRRIPVAIITLVGSLVVAACSGRDTTAPRGMAAGGPNASVTPSPSTTCDFSAIKTAARGYFTSNQDSALTYDAAMQKAYNGGKDTVATTIGWQIGRLVANERLTAATTNATAGSVYLIDVLRCMSDVAAGQTNGVYPPLPLSANFLNNAVSILQHGIWDVRGGASPNEFPAAGRVIDNSTSARNFGLPRWGAEPVNTTWPGATQYAVFGYPTNIGTLVIGSATNINTNEIPANAFELGTLPDGTPKTGIRVGVCISVDNPTTSTANRIVHSNSQVLDYSTMTALCAYSNTSFVASATAPTTWYASFLHRAESLLAPNPAFAQSLTDCTNCIGGLPSGWSPFSTGAITASNVAVSFTTEPSNTVVNTDTTRTNDTAVIQTTINGVAMPGVKIDSISVSNNSGSPAGAVITSDNLPVTTNATGFATINFSVGKAGGYLITVCGHLDAFPTQCGTSTLFNVKNQ